jgi:Leucine-rich repeat (LRR) protein
LQDCGLKSLVRLGGQSQEGATGPVPCRWLSQLTNLRELYLQDNQLAVLPDLSQLTNLRELDLENNQLAVLPDLSQLTHLERLYLYNNQLAVLPESLWLLPSLQILSFRDNPLESLSLPEGSYTITSWLCCPT